MPGTPPSIQALVDLGLTAPEAEVYVHLLARAEPVTAYRVGKDLGRATANVYKTMDALADRGAVVIGEGEPRTCRAVPVDELLEAMSRGWADRARRATELLADLRPPPPDERVYELRSAPLVIERCRRMLAAAESVAVLDIFPGPFAALADSIAACAARGVRTFVLVYEHAPPEIAGADVVTAVESDAIRRHWRSQQVNCVVDAREAMIALLSEDGDAVHEATWTRRLYLCCMLHAGFLREHAFHRVAPLARASDAAPSLQAALDASVFFHHADVPGQRELFRAEGIGRGPHV